MFLEGFPLSRHAVVFVTRVPLCPIGVYAKFFLQQSFLEAMLLFATCEAFSVWSADCWWWELVLASFFRARLLRQSTRRWKFYSKVLCIHGLFVFLGELAVSRSSRD